MGQISHVLGSFATDAEADDYIATVGWTPSELPGMLTTNRAPGLQYLNTGSGRMRTLTPSGWTEDGAYTTVETLVDSDFPAAVAAAGSLRRTLIIYKSMNVPTNVTVPRNIDLQFTKNGKLTLASGVTLGINGGFKAPARQVLARVDGTASVLWGSPDVLNVLWFGAVRESSNDEQPALEFAIDSLPATEGRIYFPPGRYRVEDTVSFRGKSLFWVDAHEADIYATGGTGFANKTVVDFTDCTDTTVLGLRVSTTGFADAKRPEAAVVIGRSTTDAAGSRMLFIQCRFTAKASVGTLYNSGSELTTFLNCRFVNSNNAPAYYEDSLDRHNLCGHPGTNVSNTERYFIDCGFRSYIGDNDGCIIWFATGNRDIVFRSCYSSFSAGSGGRGQVIRMDKDPLFDYGNCERVLVDDFRAESNDEDVPLDQSDSRFIYIDNPNVILELTVRDVFFTPGEANPNPPDCIIEVNQGGLSGADIDFKNYHDALVLLAVGDGATVEKSRFVVPTADFATVAAGTTIQDCVVEVLDCSDTRFPVTGDGTVNNLTVNGQVYTRGQAAAGGGATIWEKTLSDGRAYVVTAVVVGEQADGAGRAMYGKAALVYRTGAGVATLEGAVQDLFPDVESDAGWDATFAVDGASAVQLNVTGDAAVITNWTAKVTVAEAPGA